MLGLMAVFTMMTVAVFNKGVTGPPESDDSEWSKKGGDQSMATMSPAMFDKVEYKNTYRELPGSMPLEAGKVDTTIITPTPASPNR